MRCPICGDEAAGEKTEQWGPEWAHVRCVKAYSLGGCDARQAQREAAAKAVPEWQPIETAPKDGTHIVVVYAKREAFGVGRIWADVVKWDNHCCGWSDDETGYIMSDATFTHWTPLPAAPR